MWSHVSNCLHYQAHDTMPPGEGAQQGQGTKKSWGTGRPTTQTLQPASCSRDEVPSSLLQFQGDVGHPALMWSKVVCARQPLVAKLDEKV